MTRQVRFNNGDGSQEPLWRRWGGALRWLRYATDLNQPRGRVGHQGDHGRGNGHFFSFNGSINRRFLMRACLRGPIKRWNSHISRPLNKALHTGSWEAGCCLAWSSARDTGRKLPWTHGTSPLRTSWFFIPFSQTWKGFVVLTPFWLAPLLLFTALLTQIGHIFYLQFCILPPWAPLFSCFVCDLHSYSQFIYGSFQFCHRWRAFFLKKWNRIP